MDHKGICKKGVSLNLNQETSKWIAIKKLVAGSFYLRIGRNFSADWMRRANLDAILDWEQSVGLGRIRLKARWGEFISEWKKDQREGWGP